MIKINNDIRMLGFRSMISCPNISHFVTTRSGGCSNGKYTSLNCWYSSGDKPENVERNMDIVCNALPQKPRKLIVPNQMHSSEFKIINSSFNRLNDDERDEFLFGVDALITREPKICISVSTADCIPVLLYDQRKQIVAAIHAGWRGTVGQIVKNTVQAMKDNFQCDARDLIAGIGPGICAENFEVGEEVYLDFAIAGFNMDSISYLNKQTLKHHIDLCEANRIQLLEAGIQASNIELAGLCTYREEGTFFSVRRSGPYTGRMVSGIMLNK